MNPTRTTPMRKNPNPSALAALTEHQQQQLLAWLDLDPLPKVLDKVAAPPPDGFGLKTHPNSLKRFYAKHRFNTAPDNATLASTLLASVGQDTTLDTATLAGLRHCAFELLHTPATGLKNFKILSRWTLKLRDQERQYQQLALARERLAFDRERYEFDISRQVLLHQRDLENISDDHAIDDEEKINRARILLFGSAPGSQPNQTPTPPTQPSK